MLSDHTTHVRDALRVHCADSGPPSAGLVTAVTDAATTARGEGMSAEKFVIWVKQMWDEVAAEGVLSNSLDPLRTRDAVISAAIKAYYVQ